MWRFLLLGLAFAAAAALAAKPAQASTRRREEDDLESAEIDPTPDAAPEETMSPTPSPQPTVPPSPLRSPFKGTPRKITPRGAFGAPRYLTRDGKNTTGTKPRADAKVHHTHQGIDLASRPRETVYPVAPGEIVPVKAGFGQIVVKQRLDDGRYAVYADLSEAFAKVGQRVGLDDPIGEASARGFVHVALRASQFGKHLDPTGLIPHG